MATTTADDPWLRELLLRGDWHADGDDAVRMAAVLAARDPVVDGSGGVTRTLLSALATAGEQGWQPADVVHAVRRRSPARSVRLVVALVAEDARVTEAASRAPAVWVDQLRELGVLTAGDAAVVAAWHRAEGRPAEESWRAVLAPPPSSSPRSRADATPRRSTWNPTPRYPREGPRRPESSDTAPPVLTATPGVPAGTPACHTSPRVALPRPTIGAISGSASSAAGVPGVAAPPPGDSRRCTSTPSGWTCAVPSGS
jgi:hypothetical protein